MTTIFELIDYTDTNIYYTVGLYLTLESAIDAATKERSPMGDDLQVDHTLKVYEREIGKTEWADMGIHRATVEWVHSYDNNDEDYWTHKIIMEGV